MRGNAHGCSDCKWNIVHDVDPTTGACTYLCTGNLNYASINPEISKGSCVDWSPDTETYLEMTGHVSGIRYRYRYLLD